MAGFRDREKQHFPLESSQAVVDLFVDQLECSDGPNLALLSTVIGATEHKLTINRNVSGSDNHSKTLEPIFPVIELSTIEALYTKFITDVKSGVDLSSLRKDVATRELVKRVSDIIWSRLTRSYYKDKAHLQSLYSYLTGNKLDCFGVAFAVVAAFQVLGFNDVHLALSEDHAWVVFGEDGTDTAEVTWHGKGNEDKRGQPVGLEVTEKSWLYLCGQAVICTKEMEVAALVSGINPSISATKDSVEMSSLQQDLLWVLYDKQHIQKYPMALGNLGDLEEINPSPGRPSCKSLYLQAIDASKKYYDNKHVYPYTYLGAYLYRKRHYKAAILAWSEAAAVVSNFNYNRQDEEIYKEFLEIANEFIPNIVKAVSNENSSDPLKLPLLRDPEVYANLLRFYDGICEWEEDSSTPVLHITWAHHMVFSLSKFDPKVREFLTVASEGDSDDDDNSDEENNEHEKRRGSHSESKSGPSLRGQRRSVGSDKVGKHENGANANDSVNGNSKEDQIQSTIKDLVSKVGDNGKNETPNPNIQALSQACGDSILNKDYLLGSGEPFTTASASTTTNSTPTDSRVDIEDFLSTKSNGTPFIGLTMDSMLKADSPADMMLCRKDSDVVADTDSEGTSNDYLSGINPVSLSLRSAKMKGLRKIFTSAKLNASAIKLQLTAQSQVHMKQSKRGGAEFDLSVRKRTRRE
ncbi:hypothetical protein LOTGIDRAFT_121605 [Lottia gigantea]|uniref:Menin n=1 Tax=Lottia gigantea TaxID=225164 RepID=V4A5H1_LOTGI|nr:hypothetical protein LOTGIDRAFT_121605 [Lottia gigantea]ESO91932.1 hypothetical protein LOTGIDRAFT_121605 [Lottia gigantea]